MERAAQIGAVVPRIARKTSSSSTNGAEPSSSIEFEYTAPVSAFGSAHRWAVPVCLLATACGARTAIETAGSGLDRDDSGPSADGEATTRPDVARDAESSLLDTSMAYPDTSTGDASTGDTSTADRRDATPLADARADAPIDAGPRDAEPDVFQPPPTCDPAADFIYVLSSPGALYRFEPSSPTSTLIGPIDCLREVQSMAVDRRGIAWVEDTSGLIHTVDTRNGHCLATVLQLPPAFVPSGMAFVSDGPGSATETLYLGGLLALGAVDPSRIALQTVATWTFGPAELTGSPDGRLFALFGRDSPEHIDELDKQTAAVLSRLDLGPRGNSPIAPLAGYGFAYWRNGFWVFGGPFAFRYELSPPAMTATVAMPFSAAGAGVSTCDVPVDASTDAPTRP